MASVCSTSIEEVKKRREEFSAYFIEEFEGKLLWLVKLLEGDDTKSSSLATEIIDAGSDALTGSAKGVIDLVGTRLINYINQKRDKKTSDKLCNLAFDFKDKQKRLLLRSILVEGSFDIFQSFEAPFMTLSTKFGAETRAMQKLAKQAVHNVLEYYETLNTPDNTYINTEIIAKGVVYTSEKTTLIPYSKTVTKDELKLNTDKLFHKVGLTVEQNGKLKLYKTRKSKAEKYGYRRLFQWEIAEQEKILSKYSVDNSVNDIGYHFVLNVNDIKHGSEEMLKYLNEKDTNYMEGRLMKKIEDISRDVIQELNNALIEELMTAGEKLVDKISELMTKLENKSKEKSDLPNPAPKYNISLTNNKINTFNLNPS